MMNPYNTKKHTFWISRMLILTLLFPIHVSCKAASNDNDTNNCNYIRDGFGANGDTEISTQTVVDGLEVPWGLAFLPNGDLLVTERPGRVRLVKDYSGNAQLVDNPVATINTANSSEGGLLGIAIHPEFENNRLFYLYITVSNGNNPLNRVEQWRLSEDGATADQVKIIYDNIHASRNHNGGRILFGPDNMLYIGTGDASSPESSQDASSPNGKILRLTPEGEIPKDNPYPESPVFLLGIRNTQGWAWPNTQDATRLWVTDHGPSGERMRFGHDEVSIVTAGDNLGWPSIYRCETREDMVAPAIVWQNAVPPGGAAIYTGDAIPQWKGSLLVGTLGSRHLQRIMIENEKVTANEVYLKDAFGRLREVAMAPDGHLYITTSNCDGRGNCSNTKDMILRITGPG